MKALIFDSETTGKALWKEPADDPRQPRIVQLGAILYDDERRVVAEMNLVVRPDGWTVPAEAAAIHGFTTERAGAVGVRIRGVLALFLALAERADVVVAHNLAFDRMMVEIEIARRPAEELARLVEVWRAKRKFCTMEESTEVLRLPGFFGKYKWPSLAEAHRHYLGVGFEGAHDAMADVRACAAVYFAMNPAPVAAGLNDEVDL